MEIFKKHTVHMKKPDHVKNLFLTFLKDGADKLQVISDFDHTLTRTHLNGVKCASTYDILEHSPLTPEEYRKQANLLFEYYHPIEVNPDLSVKEKIPLMQEWYTKSHALMKTSEITKNDIEGMVASSHSVMRDGCDVLFQSLYTHKIPFLVFSAGVGDVLQEILKQQKLVYPNVKIIANFMHFDEKEKLLGFKGELIHSFNKNQNSISNSDYFQQTKGRNNIILLGDSLGDADMAEGAEDVNCILKIGFLNMKITENLPQYLDTYDVVLTDDQTMDIVNGLLQNIL